MRGNFTLIDNLRLGIKGSKEGMQEVIDKVNEWNAAEGHATNYVMGNYADMQKALVDYVKMRGLAGTAEVNLSKTISGSITQLKSAFDNFLNGSGSPEALSEAVMNFIRNIANTVQKLAPSILSGLVSLIKDLIPQVIKLLLDLLPQLASALTDLIDSLLEMVSSNTEGIANAVSKIINTIVLFITENLPKVVEMAIQLVVALANGIAQSIPVLVPEIVKCIITIVNTLLENLDLIVDTAITLVMTLADALTNPESIDYLLEQVPIIIEKLIEALMKNAPKLAEMGLNLIMKFIEAILRILPKMPDFAWKIIKALGDGIYYSLPEIVNRANDIINSIKEELGKVPDKAIQWGKDMIDGLAKGIKGAVGKVKEAVGGIGNAIKSFLHFSRPDTGPLREYETWMPDFVKGLARTLKNSSGILADATLEMSNDMANSVIANTSNALRGLKSGVNASLNPTINPNINYDLNYQLMANAMVRALQECPVILNEREVGRFVDERVSEEVYS